MGHLGHCNGEKRSHFFRKNLSFESFPDAPKVVGTRLRGTPRGRPSFRGPRTEPCPIDGTPRGASVRAPAQENALKNRSNDLTFSTQRDSDSLLLSIEGRICSLWTFVSPLCWFPFVSFPLCVASPLCHKGVFASSFQPSDSQRHYCRSQINGQQFIAKNPGRVNCC